MDFIEPENDEIRRWLLLNGVDNDVVPAYSAMRVFELGRTEFEERCLQVDINE